MADLILDHVERDQPPWRPDRHVTECGRPCPEFAQVISRQQFIAKIREQGKQRSAMTTCMTCWNAAARHGGWDTNPVDVLFRGIGWGGEKRGQNEARDLLTDELRVITALIDRHRDEFDQGMADLAGTVSLAEARQAKNRRR